MKLVVDTNVVVSAALNAGRARRILLFIADRPDLEWLVSEEILIEGVSRRIGAIQIRLSAFGSPTMGDLLARTTSVVGGVQPLAFDRDAGDAKFLACAIAGHADFLITGDKDFSGIVKIGPTTVITISDFDRLVVEPLADAP